MLPLTFGKMFCEKLIDDLKSVNCIDFLDKKVGVEKRLTSLQKNDINHDLFELVIGDVIIEVRDRKKRLEDEFEKL